MRARVLNRAFLRPRRVLRRSCAHSVIGGRPVRAGTMKAVIPMVSWRRSTPQMQAATESVAVAPSSPVSLRPAKSPRSRMMRQYDLVERVRTYNPETNEDLLNRAYVYAMKAHGAQTRASGDPFFSHPLEVAAILTDLKLDDATIVAALLHDTIEDTEATRGEI